MRTAVTDVRMCMGSSCFSRCDEGVLPAIQQYIAERNLQERVDFRGCLCQGQCNQGPNLSIGGREFHGVSLSNIRLILRECFEAPAPPPGA